MTGLDEEAQRSPSVINVGSLDRAFDDQLALEGAPQDALKGVGASLEDGIPTWDSSHTGGVTAEAPLKVATAPSFLIRLASANPRRLRMHDRLLLSLYVPSQEWVPYSADTMAHGLEGAWEIIDFWSLFNKYGMHDANSNTFMLIYSHAYMLT